MHGPETGVTVATRERSSPGDDLDAVPGHRQELGGHQPAQDAEADPGQSRRQVAAVQR